LRIHDQRTSAESGDESSNGDVRLNAYIARCSATSRRGADRLIRYRRVLVNGRPAEIGQRVDPNRDTVLVDNQKLTLPDTHTTILLNKPAGYLVSRRDPHHTRTVYDLLPENLHDLVPIGRLDLDTEGLLLLSNDGDLVERMTHPRYQIPKTYRAIVRGRPDESAMSRLRNGIEIDGEMTHPAEARIIGETAHGIELEFVLREGRKRQVRLMCRAIGHPVVSLRRILFAGLSLEGVKPGTWRVLTNDEVDTLKNYRGTHARGAHARGAHA